MQELVKVSKQKIGEEEVLAVNARDLHEALGVRKDFSDWIKTYLQRFKKNRDYGVFPLKGVNSKGGAPSH